MRTHLFIPDTQVKEGVPYDHLGWIGQYVVDKKPDVVIHAGDHADMPSLSSYDKGTKSFEGRRYKKDIIVANRGFDILNAPLRMENGRLARNKKQQWWPERHFLLGNHENRINRAINATSELDGAIGVEDLNYEQHGWTVHPFLEVVDIDGVWYSHYFYNPMTGNPYGGEATTMLKNIGHSFTMGHRQTYQPAIRYVGNQQIRGLVAGACLAPHHKVLTADLRYIPLGDVVPGMELVSFDETVGESQRRGRAFKTGTVLAVRISKRAVKKVTFDDGKEIIATPDHRWLTRVGGQLSVREGETYMWRTTDQLRSGTRIPQPLSVWETANTYEAGYLAGMFDGEGCLYTRETSGGPIAQLSFSQKPGEVYDLTAKYVENLCGVEMLGHTNQQGVISSRLRGGTPSIAKFLGQVRPVRLLPKFRPELLGQMTATVNNKVVSIEDAGVQEIVEIDIDSGTMIVEGQPHHNCYLHEEDYKGPQGNHHWRGIILKTEVQNGAYNLIEVSLDYLCRRYEGVSLEKFRTHKF